MIYIALAFGLIGLMEWTYLDRKKRSVRTHWVIIGLALFLLFSCEALYLFRNYWSLGSFINSIFEPIQRMMVIAN
jgi:hypothetical protein